MSPLRLIVVALGVAALFGAPSALACGVDGYSYAGVGATSHAYGIGASVTPVTGFNVSNGHVAGWSASAAQARARAAATSGSRRA